MVSANEVKRRQVIMIGNDPFQVIEISIVLPAARGASTMVHLKVRHLLNGMFADKSFKASEKFNEADVEIAEANYLYKDGEGYHFMDQSTFETLSMPEQTIGELSGYLHEQLGVKVIKYNGNPVSIELPQFVNLKVAETEYGGQQAGSAGSGTKNATLETGLVVRVPKHITPGEAVRVNTETGEVFGRAQIG